MSPPTMAAVLLTGHGGLEKLQYRTDVPVPQPAPGEVLIRVAAAGINNTDVNTRIGWYSKGVGSDTGSGGSAGFDTVDDEDATWSGKALEFPRVQGAEDPEDMRARVAEHRAAGYRAHSVEIGATDADGGPALDAERIRASLADRRPGEYFVVDANGGLIPDTALRMLRLLPEGLDFTLEAPCATWRETISLRRRCPVPIVVDELAQLDGDLALIAAEDVADGIGLKISKAGGLTPGRRHRDVCRAAGLTVSVQDTVGSSLAFAAILHLGATVVPRLLRGVLNCEDMVTVRTAALDTVRTAGGILPGTSPGLGAMPLLDVLGDPVQTWAV